MIYTAPYVGNVSDAGKSVTTASGRGLGPGNRDFFGPCNALKLNPLPLAQVPDLPLSKILRTGLVKSIGA